MIELTDSMVVEWFGRWLWPFIRILGLLMTAPVLGTRTVPAPARLVIGAAIATVLFPFMPPGVEIDPLSIGGLITVAHQVIIGAALGLSVRLIFMVFEVGGQLIAQQMGLGFASMVDPQTGGTVPVIAQFYVVMGTLLFLTFNGHLMLVETLAYSFEVLPVGAGLLPAESLLAFFDWTGFLLGESLRLALPVLTALLIVNVAFGIMSRAAPQLNIFAVGFPIMMLGGTLTMIATFTKFPVIFERLLESAMTFVNGILTL